MILISFQRDDITFPFLKLDSPLDASIKYRTQPKYCGCVWMLPRSGNPATLSKSKPFPQLHSDELTGRSCNLHSKWDILGHLNVLIQQVHSRPCQKKRKKEKNFVNLLSSCTSCPCSEAWSTSCVFSILFHVSPGWFLSFFFFFFSFFSFFFQFWFCTFHTLVFLFLVLIFDLKRSFKIGIAYFSFHNSFSFHILSLSFTFFHFLSLSFTFFHFLSLSFLWMIQFSSCSLGVWWKKVETKKAKSKGRKRESRNSVLFNRIRLIGKERKRKEKSGEERGRWATMTTAIDQQVERRKRRGKRKEMGKRKKWIGRKIH